MSKFNIPKEDKFVKKICIAIAILAFIIMSGTLLFKTGARSYSDSFSKTIELIAHVDIKQGENQMLVIFMSLLGYVTQFYILYVVLEYVLEGKMRNILTEVKTMNTIKHMKDHFIICGGGRVGRHVADEIIRFKKPYVILESDDSIFARLKKDGYTAIHADALDEKELEKTGIKKASYMIACLGDDSDNILLVLTAKELSQDIDIAARAGSESIIRKLKHAGAKHIVLPEVLGGMQLAHVALKDKLEGA